MDDKQRKKDLNALKNIPPWDWPEGAGKMFLEVLGDAQADESDRLFAADLAGDYTVINDELVEALLSILGSMDESEELRGLAAISLGPALEHADVDDFDDPDDLPMTKRMFGETKDKLRKLYMDAGVPKFVRRRILEASVRAHQEWHRDAIRAAYASGDEDWKLSAVFSMRWVRGFDDQILEALESDKPEIQYQAVCAAGNWRIDAAWSHVASLVISPAADKSLLLAAIEAVVAIRPEEAGMILVDLTDSEDEDIVEAADEAMLMAEDLLTMENEDEDEDEEGGFVH